MKFVTTEGKVCCSGDHLCDSCTEALALSDPYGPGLKKLRAAQGIAEPTNDVTDQLRAMAANRDAFYEVLMENVNLSPATSAVHLNPPDPYAEGLAKMRSERR